MPYLIIDLEMTGTESGYHDIIQIGAILANSEWTIISEFESLVYPENQETISMYSEKIHGISIEDLEDAPMAHEVIEELEEWCRKSLRKDASGPLTDITICGQSVINDINFLREEYKRQKYNWPFSNRIIDLFSITFIFYKIFDQNKLEHPKSLSLKNVSEYFKLNREEKTHNALEDAKLTFSCFKKYFDLIKKLKMTD